MASLRAIRNRIRSVTSTQKITKAMKMVAAARFRRAQASVQQSRPYSRKAEELLESLAASLPKELHPLLNDRPVKKRLLVVYTSDRGLCGSFNSNILRLAEKEIFGEMPTVVLPLGKKALQYATKRGAEIFKGLEGFWREFTYAATAALVKEFEAGFVSGAFDRVDLLFNEFVSVITQRPTMKTLLPVSVPSKGETPPAEYLFEPGRDAIVRALVPKIVDVRFYAACLNSQASEHGARMTAMDSATRNASDMMDALTLHMNRARQAAITKELMEIIGGAEALR